MLQDKVVVVTGAGRGLGQAYAIEAARLGAKVVAGDILDCSDTVSRIEVDSGTALSVELDVTKIGTVSAMVENTIAAFGQIDVLINNAALYGGLTGGRFDMLDEDEWDRTMDVNVKGIWNCCKAVVPHMKNAGGGSIINVASLAATYGLPYALHYTTSKAAVIGMTRGLARELGRNEIRVIKLVGGTDMFIARPFLYSGLFFGLAGGVLACILQLIVLIIFNSSLQNLLSLYEGSFQLQGFGVLPAIALVLCGGISAWISALMVSLANIRAIDP